MISVCIASFNGEKFIVEQLMSILMQLNYDDEVIISDDSSTDDTLLEIQSVKDTRIKIIPNCKFHSPIFNLENALKHSSGDIIFLSDQDDVWLPGKVDRVINSLKNFDLILTNAFIVDEKLNKQGLFFKDKLVSLGFQNLLFNNYIGATMAFKKDVLKKALPFPKIIPMHDQWIGLIGYLYFHNTYISEPLILYRRHGKNASFSGERSSNPFIRKILFRVLILVAIVMRLSKITYGKIQKDCTYFTVR